MKITTKLSLIFMMNVAMAVIIASLLFGWENFVNKLGGLASLGGLAALMILAAVVLGGIVYLQMQDYENRNGDFVRDLIIAFVVVMVLGGIGYRWVDLPDGTGVKVLTCIFLIALVSGIEAWIGRRSETTT